MKKKVLHIISSIGLGGAETALYRLLCTLSSSDYAFFVIILGEAGYYSAHIKKLGIPIYHLAFKKINFIKKIFTLLLLIKSIKPDIVQTWMYHADLIGGGCARLCGIKKIIWGIRCEGLKLKLSTRGIKKACAWFSNFIPNTIIVNSARGRDNHILAGYNLKKMQLIYNGFDTTHFCPNPHRLFPRHIGNQLLNTGTFIFGTLSRFHYDKDYQNLLQVIDPVCRLFPNVYFILCGPGCCAHNPELSKLILSVNHKDKIILLNGVDDAVWYLNQLDVFILSSRTEGFPNCLAEAMSCGLPCIATDVGEVKEILGPTGLLIPKENAQRLAAACLSMLQNTLEQRKQLGIAARARIKSCYSMSNNKMKIIKLYEQ